AGARHHRHPHVIVRVHRRGPLRQLGDHRLVEGVADVGAIEREVLDHAFATGQKCLKWHFQTTKDAKITKKENLHYFVFFVTFVVYIRNTPNLGGGIGALNAAERASPSTWRVCAGSRIPSS